ncbi:hypothetical protein [Argonema galeatum]|uniref:hypothetical protein n=1 Tax=Argonema galeatum TaxID=2942762 RepID=UPI002010E055|nr:hypothetical protein [Argonema galeatum]MCL1464043.1 hypothetical protein [Argonema galeatum A003/A1]
MNFEEIWQEYDFTEAELLSMGWQLPNDYILNFNYYWQLKPNNTSLRVASADQPLNLILKSCIRLDVKLNPNADFIDKLPANLGTIIGWGKITPSPWLENLCLPPQEWIHLFFDIGGDNRIEAVCRGMTIEQLKRDREAEPLKAL